MSQAHSPQPGRQPGEPTAASLSHPLLRYLLATRPAFLSVTLFGVLIGLASARMAGVTLAPGTAVVTLLFALVAHAGINVLNDYYDALNGTDDANTERVFPFTGGSRFIQNGVLTRRETFAFGIALMAAVIAAGLWLTLVSAPGLLFIGAAGVFIGCAYSAPPLKLNSRGWGEACVWAGFAMLAVGADFVQRGAFATGPLVAVACYALLVTNILYINQFPDYRADLGAGKHHWVVRLGPARARWLYVLFAAMGYLWVVIAVARGSLPKPALLALAPALLSALAARDLQRFALAPQQLAPAIRKTIAAACLHGALMAGTLALSRVGG